MAAQSVLVTGAASGIGLACARMLLERGHSVTAFDIQADRLADALPVGDRTELVTGDVAKTEDCGRAVQTAIDRFGRLDALIHWGAAHSTKRWDELGAEECNHVVAVNVTGSFLIAQAAARHMVARGSGSIVLTTSTSVLFGGTGGGGSGGPAYVSSKGAVIALTRSLAKALGPQGVRVNAVSPGITPTAMTAGYTDETKAEMIKRFPLRRFAKPEEIAAVGCFLISEDAGFITGEVVHANGGSNFN